MIQLLPSLALNNDSLCLRVHFEVYPEAQSLLIFAEQVSQLITVNLDRTDL